MACSNLDIDIVPVERAAGGERGDGTIDPIEQAADLRAIVDIVAGQHRRDDPACVRVRGEVELAP
jgi:hypothetical protein